MVAATFLETVAMEAMGALSNPRAPEAPLRMARATRNRLRLASRRGDQRSRPGDLPLLRAVEAILADSDHPMHIASLHAALEQRLQATVSRASLKDCLSDHARGKRPTFLRQKRGWYRPS